MPKYIFLDTWVFSELKTPGMELGLAEFLRKREYTILFTSLSLVELYNPNWEAAGQKDRTLKAVRILSDNPSIIIDPPRVIGSEAEIYPKRLTNLPVELDLKNIPEGTRALTLLSFLRGDETFAKRGKNIRVWSERYNSLKKGWLNDVERIIDDAYEKGNLQRDSKGRMVNLNETKEQFLLSLEMSYANPQDIDALMQKLVELFNDHRPRPLTAVRLWALCFWYAYVNIDRTNQLRQRGSDVGDIYHLSLLPYCAAFTADKNMSRLIRRMREPIVPSHCELIDVARLKRYLSAYSPVE